MTHDKNYKRQTRQLKNCTKQLISQKLKGKMKSPQHVERIRTGMRNYWKTVKNGEDSV